MPPAATRIVAVPPNPRWTEQRLVDAARDLDVPRGIVRPGDALGDLVVVRVEPENGAVADDSTSVDVLAKARARRGPVHVAVLIDASDSMGTAWSEGRTRLSAARDALGGFLSQPQSDAAVVTLLTYAKDVRIVAGPTQRAHTVPFELPVARGRARTAQAVNAALAHLAAQSHEGPQALVLLSDGAAEVKELRAAAQRARRLGIAIHVVSFAPTVDTELEALAHATGGTSKLAIVPLTFDVQRKKDA
ncbi:MAG: VWA domain-containing protein [Candidatus Thermoplasmatota archaeon]